jgi:hypothetical protein
LTDRSTAFEVDARIVVLCALTLESVRILLNSRSSQHPAGVGDSSGVLGRFLCDHMAQGVGGLIPDSTAMAISPSGGPYGICIPRFRNLFEKNSESAGRYGIARCYATHMLKPISWLAPDFPYRSATTLELRLRPQWQTGNTIHRHAHSRSVPGNARSGGTKIVKAKTEYAISGSSPS